MSNAQYCGPGDALTRTFDEWDITTGVGLTALAVAAARAIETDQGGGLVRDDYARVLVEAAAPPIPLPTRAADIGTDPGDRVWPTMTDYMALRSRVFDDFFIEAGADGIRQVVILAAGLDARAFRLAWPPGTTVYEIDRPTVLEFKQRTLDAHGAVPACERRSVPTDLRDDWATALRAAGFDPARPTAWLAEGLLPYLPARAEEDLFATVHALSAPGSRMAVEALTEGLADTVREHPLMRESGERLGVDIGTLWNDEPRRDCATWLRSVGWSVQVESTTEAAHRHGRPLDGDIADAFGAGRLVTAQAG
ncbi:SAM-dependent methyltransferase [Pseudonocardia acidicola]|uniref:S-adenosyl-L-methionine-dependent methyltransferase n=1 Tax=Pseudonocardia acidicola TaxID=2724939 RepID=A0ABX1S659_9PSEU|nr:SAM-dependent methyltransferase [Pseudonocardia acidicola]NMH96277.1 SAM-dependent methyltransferase [Pseudonocardia acidicola]